MVNYEEFKENFKEDVTRKLAKKGIENVEITIQPNEKLNQSYDALTVRPDGSTLGVSLNFTKIAEEYENRGNYDSLVDAVAKRIENGLENAPFVDSKALTDYEQMKDKLTIELVGAEKNASLLEKIPHKDMENMAIVYRFVMGSDDSGVQTILVTNNMLEAMNITPEQLHNDAMANAPEVRPAEIKIMRDTLAEMLGPDADMMLQFIPADGPESQIYVATVEDKVHGVGVIAYPNFLEDVADKLDGDFYVLPSSIHEVIIVPDRGEMDASVLMDMVKQVNSTEVLPEDVLSYSVYHFDSQDNVFELAEKFDARSAEREAAKEDKLAENGAVLKGLKEKKAAIKPEPKKEDIVKNTFYGINYQKALQMGKRNLRLRACYMHLQMRN
ncbi:DUF5688 family protein [Pseudobutyrivibrio sp. MD2005]|uniref:DUF5688 family protein n=1 Tax=Pseudobutyrivibrio sp. MD2005 TaxID=1410616 RepID=UPI000686F582|nr:DUF5688 family protein [Pseudobutyrivibrio sp. MD2005]